MVSGPVGTHCHIFVLSKTFTCFEMGPPLQWEEGFDCYWSPLSNWLSPSHIHSQLLTLYPSVTQTRTVYVSIIVNTYALERSDTSMGDNRKIYSSSCGNAYKGLKIRQKRELKWNASNQANNHIQELQFRARVREIYVLQCPPTTRVPSVKRKLNPGIRNPWIH
jgi:hypothetical protein